MKYAMLLFFFSRILLASDVTYYDSEGNSLIFDKGLERKVTPDFFQIMQKDGDEFVKALTEHRQKRGLTEELPEEASLSGYKIFYLEQCPGSPATQFFKAGYYQGYVTKIVKGDEIIVTCAYDRHIAGMVRAMPTDTVQQIIRGHYIVYDLVSKKKKREGWADNGQPCGMRITYDKQGKRKDKNTHLDACSY